MLVWSGVQPAGRQGVARPTGQRVPARQPPQDRALRCRDVQGEPADDDRLGQARRLPRRIGPPEIESPAADPARSLTLPPNGTGGVSAPPETASAARATG